jgi:hypothetical protein
MPYRIPAPPDPDPPEIEEPYVAALRGQERRARIGAGLFAAAFLGLAGVAIARPQPSSPREDPGARIAAATRAWNDAQRLEARAGIGAAHERAKTEQVRFERAIRTAVDQGVGPRPDLGACPVTLERREGLFQGSSFPVLVVDHADAAAPIRSQAVAEFLADVGRAESHLEARRFDDASRGARALATHGRLRVEVVVVATKYQGPVVGNATRYSAGELAGRAYLYDFGAGAVLCAADVRATNSDAVSYASRSTVESLGYTLERDLHLRLESAIVDAMRFRSGPILAE